MSAWTPLPPSLTTDRLFLGPWEAGDVDAYGAMVLERDPRTAAAPRTPPSQEQLIAAITRQQAALESTGICLYAIRVDGKFAGYCGLVIGRSTLDEPELGYELLQRFHGHGYATDAARAVVAAAADTGRRRLWATVREWNAASFHVLTKVGFVASDRTTVDEFGPVAWWTKGL